jgi:pyruvate kinase
MRRTKIVATLGPASNTPDMIGRLLEAGADVARLNCSHVKHTAEFEPTVEALRRVCRLAGRPAAVLLDLCGPKVRTGELVGDSMELVTGAALRVVPGTAPGEGDFITTNHAGLPDDVHAGQRILLDDGLLELRVVRVEPDRTVLTEVVVGGTLKPRKGMNLPDATVSIPALTEKDKRDLAGAIDLGMDYVALSFVQRREDVIELKRELAKLKARPAIVAKIEKPQAIENIDGILAEVDAIMVARGDLAVEVGNHKVPVLQKQLIARASLRGTLDIVATQMLESMTQNPRPTRAEASDVANAILDGADAVMLSGETASGRYPVEAVRTMDRIAREVEGWSPGGPHRIEEVELYPAITMSIVRAAADIARGGGFRALIVFTLSGLTARLLSGFDPPVPIFAFTPRQETERAMCLYRGVRPVLMPFPGNSDEMIAQGERLLVERGFLKKDDSAVVVAGFTALRGVANMVKVVRV